MSGLPSSWTEDDCEPRPRPDSRERGRPGEQSGRVPAYRWRWPFDEAEARGARRERILVASLPWLVLLIGLVVWGVLGRG
jgi:hypothetical protein